MSEQPEFIKDKVVLNDFFHIKGKHCETTSLMKVLNDMGYSYDEDFLFGLAGGIGFVNWYSKGMQNPFVGCRNGKFPDFLNKLCSRLQIEMELTTTSSCNKSEKQVWELLLQGKPAIVYGNIAELPYFKSNSHFGQHAFVVYGIDYGKDTVYISDRGGKPQTLSLDTYRTAHGMKCKPYPPNNAVITVHKVNADRVDLQQVVIESILETCNQMLQPPIRKFGLEGMRVWAEELREFPSIHPDLPLISYLFQTFIHIETAGTGGKGFRSMYSSYLSMARDITGVEGLAEMSERCKQSSELWRGISEALLNKQDFGELSDLILMKEELFMREGTVDCAEGEALDRQIKDQISEANQHLKRITENLPYISLEIMKCFEAEKVLFEGLRQVLS
ncbi:BtrH N-terminal domain-containing protein [Paenibacillus sp. NPDC057934]|uniref:BtrH N-terminal domain-containing protein n=1 Tax=Paenibacillus sp. NPDC057934 TaxID=3346282 RepID=UPI0036D9BD1B